MFVRNRAHGIGQSKIIMVVLSVPITDTAQVGPLVDKKDKKLSGFWDMFVWHTLCFQEQFSDDPYKYLILFPQACQSGKGCCVYELTV